MIDRRALLLGSASLVGAAMPVTGGVTTLPAPFAEIERRTFDYFWHTTNPINGLAPDRWPSAGFASIAATGFALTALPIGVARGWITRAQASARTLACLRFFWNAPQGDAAQGMTGHKGFFYHFLHLENGQRFRDTELSSVDTALLLGGILFTGRWFDHDTADEAEIRDLAARIYARVDWRWMRPRAPLIAMGWHPERGFIALDWVGYNEAMLVYVLALGAPDHAIEPDAWTAWTDGYAKSWRGDGATKHLAFSAQFAHQYSHIWVDFRGIRDGVMREAGFDYFENSRRATYAQRVYAASNPMGWRAYSQDIWGLTASDGPAYTRHDYHGTARVFRGYSARGPARFPDGFDDGTLAPTALIGSLPFAPEIVEPATRALLRRYGPLIYGPYGFLDSFNPSFSFEDVKLDSGRLEPGHGWVATDRLGIDQGPIVAMIANHRDGLVWATMRRHPAIRRGLMRAGFAGGWLEA